MRVRRYRGRHLRPANRKRGPVVVGTAAAVWFTTGPARAAVHVVSAGETLSEIAARYGTSVSTLASVNGLRDPDAIVAGQSLRVPARVFMDSIHVVRAGETLSSIAARYGTSPQTLARVNHLKDPNLIVAGTQLRVPGSGGVASSGGAMTGAGATATHVVARGETLSSIAARFGTTTTALARINDLANPNLIVAGTSLDVPAGAPATSSPAAAPTAVPVEQVAASLERQALVHGVDSHLVKAVAWQESGWRQDVISSAGAIGVMQVMPGTARFVNRVLGGGSLDVRTADDNVHLGVMYLHHLLGTMGSERKALAAYLAGPGNVHHRLTREQQRYVDAVQSHKNEF